MGGWSFSPFIAQSTSMALILTALEQSGRNVDVYKNLSSPPSMIHLNSPEDGILDTVAFVWYDNILVF